MPTSTATHVRRALVRGIAAALVLGAAPAARASSVFSVGGLGEPSLEEGARVRAMGGAGAAEFGPHRFSLVNPASTAGVEHLILQGTILPSYRRVQGSLGAETAAETVVPSLRALVRLPGKIVLGAAYAAGTNASFAVERRESAGTPSLLRIDGTGGLQSIRISAARALSSRLRVGAEWEIVAGSFREEWVRDFDDPALATQRDTLEARYERQGRWRLGAQGALGRWTLGGAVETSRRLPLTLIRRAAGTRLETSGRNLTIPSGLVVGAAGPLAGRWDLAAQYRRANWKRSSLESDLVDFRALQRFSLGLELRPPEEFRRRWLSRLPLRIGVSYLEWPDLLPLAGQPTIAGGTAGVDEWAISLGTGIRTQDGGGSVDFSIEAGTRGSEDDLGVNERFLRAGITLQVSDDTWK